MRLGVLTLWLTACGQPALDPPLTQVFSTPFSVAAAHSENDNAVAPLPHRVEVDARKAELGGLLFADPRLSADGRVACSSCHAFEHGGAIPEVHSSLPGRPATAVNVPSVFNVAFNARFAWNGRFADIGQQLDAAMSSRAAMNASFQQAARVVSRDPALSRAFEAVYAGGVSPGAVREALAVYCLSLVTPDARFDRYLRGELTLSAAEQSGYELFRELGCISCHQGVNLGGNLLQRFGVVVDYFAVHGSHSPADDGLFEETRDPADLHVFRVPSLRNVAVTAPYFHDGSAAELAQAVRDMAQFQLGRTLSQAETSAIVAFLEALSGELSPTRP